MARKLIEIFRPYVPSEAFSVMTETLASKWIGQGPLVDNFEEDFERIILKDKADAVAVNSCTSALHLAFILAGLERGSEVLVPVYTCTASSMPLIHMGCQLRFVDVDLDTMNISLDDLAKKICRTTKAIVVVDYGGAVNDMDSINAIAKRAGATVIHDAAQSIGGAIRGNPVGTLTDYTAFSFQAIKTLTTGDGGMLTMGKGQDVADRAKRLRWFGIDRKAKLFGNWDNEIVEAGYKYQMTDIAAGLGIAGLGVFERTLSHRRKLLERYAHNLADVFGIRLVARELVGTERHAAWSCTVEVQERQDFEAKMTACGIESGQVHYRNDRYKCFRDVATLEELPNMDYMESRYHMLPLHMSVTIEDVDYICDCIKGGW